MKSVLAGAAIAALMAAPLAAHAAQGLSGSYYIPNPDLGFGDSPGGPGSLANALSQISGETPTATFIANTICFPSCGNILNDGGSTIADFLGGNASNLSGGSSVTDLSNHVVVLSGYLNVPTTGMYSLSLGSDDGSEVLIGGAQVLDNDGDHSFNTVSTNLTLLAGAHTIEIVQFEDGGGTGLTVDLNGAPLGGSSISTSAVPEPAGWALMLVGFGALGAVLRSRRRAVAA
jgi:hypothetical protein